MDFKELLSVVIPCYNSEKTIAGVVENEIRIFRENGIDPAPLSGVYTIVTLRSSSSSGYRCAQGFLTVSTSYAPLSITTR